MPACAQGKGSIRHACAKKLSDYHTGPILLSYPNPALNPLSTGLPSLHFDCCTPPRALSLS